MKEFVKVCSRSLGLGGRPEKSDNRATTNMLLASAVVVWEWLNEHGRWRPYSPAVSHQIEAAIRSSDPRGGSVVLGQVDSRLSPYIIDLQSMHQFRQDTGTIRPVRRSFYDPTSAPGQGWQWEWENDAGTWTPYDMEVAIAIESAHSRQQTCLDLTPLGFCYVIDFKSMTQVNRQSQRCRRIQRRADLAYPLVSGPLPLPKGGGGGLTGALLGVGVSGASMGVGASVTSNESVPIPGPGQPCSCQQCMLVLSVKSNTGGGAAIQTLGRRSLTMQRPKTSALPPPKPLSPSKSCTLGRGQPQTSSYYQTLPHGLAITRNVSSPRRNDLLFAQSLAALTAGASSMGISASSTRPPPPSLPPPQPPSSNPPSIPPKLSSSTSPSANESVPTATLITPASNVTTPPSPVPSPSSMVMKPQRAPPSTSSVCHAPLPQRSSLAGLSRPALQRIAMAQSRALIASGKGHFYLKAGNNHTSVLSLTVQCCRILLGCSVFILGCLEPERSSLRHFQTRPIRVGMGPGHDVNNLGESRQKDCKTPEEVVKKYLQKVKSPPEEDCTICMEPLGGPSGYKGPGVGPVSKAESVGRLAQCGHQYHFQCLVAMYNNGNKDGSLQCPTCKTIYGVKTGNQPAGKMEYHIIPHSLPGHPDCKTVRIIYNIPPGIQGPEHPNPGKPFTARGFPRHCYLPDSEKGRKVLRLLLVAWDRRLIFSVGTSSTTGESDTVIWNEVHHKTEFGSNLTGHGFPDPGHLDNVLEELRSQGITEEDALVEK
ncbi:E3 ubiquitin-protein ligase DTX1-like [Nothobranchius furzeri]|uniref:E3 ubiquitin-protein ligase n=1 Tax=Nothobranchius furzeri TaxID=105023 RepID=A0A9D2YC75_NOTFU|nr:E3 ubiquitin-protein ligase DTX1-like [Nothobranchius furzeri]